MRSRRRRRISWAFTTCRVMSGSGVRTSARTTGTQCRPTVVQTLGRAMSGGYAADVITIGIFIARSRGGMGLSRARMTVASGSDWRWLSGTSELRRNLTVCADSRNNDAVFAPRILVREADGGIKPGVSPDLSGRTPGTGQINSRTQHFWGFVSRGSLALTPGLYAAVRFADS